VPSSSLRVSELLGRATTRSFEFFPPKSDDESAVLERTLSSLRNLNPSFVSVTYRGGRESRQRTFDLVTQIQRTGELTAMAHLICVGHRRHEMRDLLKNYLDAGVVNVMALGGDVPDDDTEATSEFRYAIELVELAREVGEFCVGVGAHPQGHPRSTSRTEDRQHLARKLEAADFAVTQFFFDAVLSSLLVNDIVIGFFKSAFFGLVIGLIACFKGLTVQGGAEGVGRATTGSVVIAITSVIGFDSVFNVIVTQYTK